MYIYSWRKLHIQIKNYTDIQTTFPWESLHYKAIRGSAHSNIVPEKYDWWF